MNFLNNKDLLDTLLKQGDTLNTINGGVSMTNVKISENENNIIISVYAPTVSGNAFNIMLNYSQLTIFSTLHDHSDFPIPMFLQTFEIPAIVDYENIEAINENNEVRVILPFKEDISRLNRLIEIKNI